MAMPRPRGIARWRFAPAIAQMQAEAQQWAEVGHDTWEEIVFRE